MFINFDYNNLIQGKYPSVSIKLNKDELTEINKFVEMAEKQQIENPAISFTDQAKDADLDKCDDESFERFLAASRLLSMFWANDDDGLLPSARQIYYAKQAKNSSVEQYVIRDKSEENGTMHSIGIYQLLERLIAYAAWHMNDDIKLAANVHDCMYALLQIKSDISTIEQTLAKEFTKYNDTNKVKKAFENLQGDDTKPLEKDSKEPIDYKKMYESAMQTMKTVCNEAIEAQKLIEKVVPRLNQVDMVKDVTNDDAYDVPSQVWDSKKKMMKDDGFMRIISDPIHPMHKSK